jgi:NADPH:quinone reductase-like Zn-dependent oxidoreductase
VTAPTRTIQPNHIIRLVAYQPKPNVAVTEITTEEFIRTWQAIAQQKPQPKGLVYRELCQQIPEWSNKAIAEMDNPILYPFLEYAIVLPEQDTSEFPPLPTEITSNYEIIEGSYSVAFRFVRDDSVGTPETIMFNLFEIDGPPALEQGFLMSWPPRGEFKTHEPGFFSAILHHRLKTETRIAAFNRSEWQDADAYAAGIPRFTEAFPRAERKNPIAKTSDGKPPIRSHLGLFKIVASITNQQNKQPSIMKAVRIHEYGSPEVLVYEDVPRPAPGSGQILIRNYAAAINPLDLKMRSGEVSKIYPYWFPDTLGYSIAGVVESVGQGVTSRRVGEEVYGINNPIMRHGYAEYVVGPEQYYYPKPKVLNWITAAAAPSIFATAYGALFVQANLQSGQRVLIHGGSGSIGSCAIQLAKNAGAYVIATASAKNLDYIKSLGADEVIDYKSQRFEDHVSEVDVVLDSVGGDTRSRSWNLLKTGGTLATLLPPPPDLKLAEKYGVRAMMVHGHPNVGEILPQMTEMLETGKLQPPEIAAVLPLAEASKGHVLAEQGAQRGRIVLEIRS